MAKQVQWLSDYEWARIEPLLPRDARARIGRTTAG
jgi:transposase